MERHVKERLIGATILVVLVVLFVPEFLPGPGHGSGPQDTDRQGTLLRYTVDAEHYPTQPPTPQGPASTAPAALASAPVAPVMPPPPASTATGASAAASPPPAPPATAPAPAAQSAARPATSTARALAAPAASSGWTLQIGSFASKANADALIRELKGEGFTAYDSPIGAGSAARFRVRIGPIADRAAATTMITRLQAHHHAAILVPPAG